MFSAQDYDDRPLSSPRSLVDLSLPSHSPSRPRARSGSLGAEQRPTIPATTTHDADLSAIRIKTDLTPRTTSPKADYLRRSTYARSSHARSTYISAPVTAVDSLAAGALSGGSGGGGGLLDRPPTTNYLNPQDRADLIRKSRKLTQLLGETPSPQSVTPPALPVRVSSETRTRTGRHSPRPIWASRPNVRSADSIDTIHDAIPISELSLVTAGTAAVGDKRTTADFIIDPYNDDTRPTTIPFFSPSSPQLDSLDSTDSMLYLRVPEEDRRRRREKIAKLHRFLGSRVPISLVLGFSASDDTLPALDSTTIITDNVRPSTTSRHTRRRSSSAAETRSNWFGPDDRLKEELDEREKAINVRRALKMEKMFGVQPPQTLYHTRHSPRPNDRVHSTERPFHSSSSSEREAVLPANRNVIIQRDGKRQRSRHRSSSHSHSESMPLLDPVAAGRSSSSGKRRASAVYMHYSYSLNSLSAIIDRDDRESLAELHSILTIDQSSGSGASTPVPRHDDNDCDDARTIRSERRRSLPTRSSTVSLASQFSLGSPSPERTSFQARRRQAAKLTHFFGVEYRDLIGDILESIERCVQEESHRGNLNAEEIQDLVVKLRNLRTKRTAV